MSLFKYGNLEVEIDFTDVDFLENLDEAKKLMVDEAAQVPKTGKTADIFARSVSVILTFSTG